MDLVLPTATAVQPVSVTSALPAKPASSNQLKVLQKEAATTNVRQATPIPPPKLANPAQTHFALNATRPAPAQSAQA